VPVSDDRGLAAHGSVIRRRAGDRGRRLRVGHVEAVGVRPDVRRKGLGGRVMAEPERVAGHAYDLGALSASGDGAALYTARGRRLWSGRICALGPDGVVHLPDDEDCTFVRPAAAGPPTRPASWSSTGGTATCSDIGRPEFSQFTGA
jgi:aminoglycoside 2'-N-acetyltransferase I